MSLSKSLPLGRVRLARIEDVPRIMELFTKPVSQTFRVRCVHDVRCLIENSVLSICQLDLKDGVIGFLAVKDFPLIPSVHSAAWEEYIWTKYKAIDMSARNTLFIHLLCWDQSYSRPLVDNMLMTIFMHDHYVHYIAMTKTLIKYPLLVPEQTRAEGSFRRVQVSERGINGDKVPFLCVAERSEVCPRLRIRRAVEEDNDDLVPILDRQAPQLRKLYGDFYISELIARHPESDRVLIVAEHKEVAVGVMCLNTQINYEALQESFRLAPFAGLRRDVSCKHYTKDDKPIPVPQESIASHGDGDTSIGNFYKDRTTLNKENTLSRESEHFTFESMLDLAQDKYIDTLLELENEMEDEDYYDIVNIKYAELLVPYVNDYRRKQQLQLDRHAIDEMHVADFIKKCEEKGRRETSSTEVAHVETVKYAGEPNAFLLEIFSVHEDYDERYGFDMLEAAFEMFPDRDYCIMCLPSNHPAFPLQEHFTLVAPSNCRTRMRFINESLYVAHVNSVRGNVRVRPGEAADLSSIVDILENVPRKEVLLDQFNNSLGSRTNHSFVLLSENQPIGLVMLGPLEESIIVRAQYDLDPEAQRAGTDGAILAAVMSPVLSPHYRWFLREFIRYTQYTTLFWIGVLFSADNQCPTRQIMPLAGYMSPVHPHFTMPNITGDKNLDRIYQQLGPPYALWTMHRSLTSLKTVYVNNSIVVVGASRTGLAFLETLLMGPTSQYLVFSNISLVSEHGLPTVGSCLTAAETCIPRHGRYTDRYIKSVPFYYYVEVISSVMVGIDRKKKCIYLQSGETKYYDNLVLTCGQQFQHPDSFKDSLDLVKELEDGKPCDRTLMDDCKYKPDEVPPPPEIPDNLMLINSLFEANRCFRKLMHMKTDPQNADGANLNEENRVVVYGECIEAYSCIAALLELGLASEQIVFVEPFPPENPAKMRVNCFNNETIDERVQASIAKLGISVMRKCYLTGLNLSGTYVRSLNLMTSVQALKLDCFALFYYGIRAINLCAFKAINESGLVYDGGIVVNPSFETNDPCIYSAGTGVRYSRRLYANEHLQRYYCSEEVGEALATLFFKKLDPFFMGVPGTMTPSKQFMPKYSGSTIGFRSTGPGKINFFGRRWEPVMKFESPIVEVATLPGPLYYMKVRKPGKEKPMAVQQCLLHQGHTLTTDKDKNYFCVHLNEFHIIDSITCLSRKEFSTDILSQLYNKHESFFNKLLHRYLNKQISDFYEFFTQPWMSLLYRESFSELIDVIRNQDIGTVYDIIKSKFTLYDEENISDSESDLPNSDLTIKTVSLDKSFMNYIKSGFSTNVNINKEKQVLGTFRSLIEKYVASNNSADIGLSSEDGEIPLECGQSEQMRDEVQKFWKQISGQGIVIAYLANYLERNAINNPHYSTLTTDGTN